ncbi:uncharacterized protein LOC106878454 [Octopus bimaculoides]|uniref:Macro domain-containing protein n=1 Tax=Octopus bimaculoides TaxID=37653 RepID=A0A0L8IA34_OCTBM|nr:uncharacterized protein LOC106878454 [Octopus bimaculoides]|eukprot:XP_014783156.1 PREDICTED: uncharacterized protein LOC106878454 [Octopus bimaculoides]
MSLIDEYTFSGFVIRLMDGKIEKGNGDTLLLPANQVISKLEGVTARIVSRARDAIVPELEKYYNIEMEIGTTLITNAGPLKFNYIILLVLPQYRLDKNYDYQNSLMKLSFSIRKAVNSTQNVQATEIATSILGIEKGYSPSLCAEAFVEGLLWFSDRPNIKQKEQIFNIYSTNKAALILMALAIEKRVYPYGKRTVYSDLFQVRKCRILEPSTNAVIVVVSRSAFEDIQRRASNVRTREYSVLCKSDDSIHMIAVEQINGRSVNEVMYVAAPGSKDIADYKHFMRVLIDQMQRTFQRKQKDISIVLDFDGAVLPFLGTEVFSAPDFHRCFLSAIKYFSKNLVEA